MSGIVSCGGYIPRYRLSRKFIFESMGWLNPASAGYARGEKAVANYDEDSLTMATAAAIESLAGGDRLQVEGLHFASTTMPYKERLNAAIMANALNLPDTIRSSDFTGGLRAGTTALISALETVEAGRAKKILVTSADTRLGKMGTVEEMIFGDGAAAFLVGDDDIIAEFKGSYSLSCDFVDHYRGSMAKYDRSWEERWIRDEGIEKFIPAAVEGLMKKYDLKVSDCAKLIYPCPYAAAHKNIAKKLGLDDQRLEPTMMDRIGNTGTPHSFLMFLSALEKSKPGDNLVVVSFGSGCDALLFSVTDKITEYTGNKTLGKHLNRGKELTSYQKYIVFKGLGQADFGLRSEEDIWTRWTLQWRNRKVFALVGTRCKACGTPQFPPQRVCVNPACGAIDQMEDYPFAQKNAHVFNYTGDLLAATFDPPGIHGQVNFEGGGRYWFEFTDCTLDEMKVGMPMKMDFRKKYYDSRRDIHGYFWKAVPVREDV